MRYFSLLTILSQLFLIELSYAEIVTESIYSDELEETKWVWRTRARPKQKKVTLAEVHPKFLTSKKYMIDDIEDENQPVEEITDSEATRNLGNEYTSIYGVNCGRSGTGYQDRVVNGTDASIIDHPWLAFLLITNDASKQELKRSWICGGSIISPDWILTAGHCVWHKEGIKKIRAYTGKDYIGGLASLSEGYIMAETFTIHNQFRNRKTGEYNDIGVIKLASPLTISESVYPICLPRADMCMRDGNTVCVAGWGVVNPDIRKRSNQLQEACVEIEKHADCAWAMSNGLKRPTKRYVKPLEVCAGGKAIEGKFKDSCQGDSGGPLTKKDNDDIGTIYGVVSWGVGCGVPGSPGMYTRVTNYLNWIHMNTGVMMDDATSLVPAKNCIDTENNPGSSNNLAFAPVPDNIGLPQNENNIIFSTDFPQRCLTKKQRTRAFDYSKGKQAVTHPNCADLLDIHKNMNYEYAYDAKTQKIRASGIYMDDYCMELKGTTPMYNKCKETELQKFIYNSDLKVIFAKVKKSKQLLALSFQINRPTDRNKELSLKFTYYYYSKFGNNNLVENTQIQMNSAETLATNIGNKCILANKKMANKMYLLAGNCNQNAKTGGWVHSDNRIYNSNRSGLKEKTLCWLGKPNKPVFLTLCSNCEKKGYAPYCNFNYDYDNQGLVGSVNKFGISAQRVFVLQKGLKVKMGKNNRIYNRFG